MVGLARTSDYVLVAQAAVRVEHFQRGADGEWTYRVALAGGRVSLANGVVVDVDAIYAGAFDLDGD